ncbi:NUDIX domain-containing protein [Nocardioides salsibiostraticola]
MAAVTYRSDYPVFYVAVDVAAFTLIDSVLQVLVVERGPAPDGSEGTETGRVALPGGFVGPEEDLTTAALRELAEETGVEDVTLEQLASYGAPGRDPRGRVVSVAHLAVLAHPATPHAGSDAATASWRAVAEVGSMAFDHRRILDDAVARLRSKLEYTAIAAAFLPERFTLAELRAVYESVWGVALDPGNFQRKLRSNGGDFVAPVEGALRGHGRGRPAQLFRALKSGTAALDNPIVRAALSSESPSSESPSSQGVSSQGVSPEGGLS